MVDKVKVSEKGSGITLNEEFDVLKHAEDGIKHHTGNHLKIVQHVANHMNTSHHGRWTVFVIESIHTPWEVEIYPVEKKHITFTAHAHEFLVYKSDH